MKILIIDTCGATGSVALADTEGKPMIVAAASLPGRSASERLVATIKELTGGADVALDSLGAVAVIHGPGSFTGVRVGLSAAKGLCEALGLPLLAVSRLAVLAQLADPSGGRVVALIDAGRGEFYLGEYSGGCRLRESLVTREQLFDFVRGDAGLGWTAPVVITCEPTIAETLAEIAPRLVKEPLAEDALLLVLRRTAANEFDDAARVDANYLRRTDAEIFAKPKAATDPPGAAAR